MKIEKIVEKYGHNRIQECIRNNKNRNDVSLDLFGYSKGKTTLAIEKYIEEYSINTEHFDKQWRNRKYEKVIRKICPQCGEEFETSGKDDNITCSCRCSNLYFADRRKVEGYKEAACIKCGSIIQIKKQTDPLKAICDECKTKKKYKCKECGRPIGKTKSGLCRTCFPKSPENRKHQSEKMRIIVEEGKHKGWATRTKLEPSYPEKYFMEVFDKEGIEYIREKKIDKYFADFVINDRIVLEVDGRQHRRDRRKTSDRKKDTLFTELGYTVFRIEWYRPTTENSKKKLYRQIKEFYDIIGHKTEFEL
jgi:very-short-patch-repair endonuclease/ribosomal protein S14